MDRAPLISIIVPVYNKEKYLVECTESLVNQTYSDKEIILVDDGSTDLSGKICDDYSQRYDFVKVIHKENGGLPSAWKAGFRLSKGEYLVFVDSDDYVEINMLEEMSEQLCGIKGELIVSDYVITKDDGSESYMYQRLSPGEYLREAISDRIVPNMLGYENRLITFSRCLKLIERSLIENNVKYCDDRVTMGEDATVILPAIFDSQRIVMMDRKVYYHYRYNNDSMVHSYDRNAYENNRLYYDILKRMIEDKFQNDLTEKTQMLESLNREELLLLLLIVKNEVRGNPEKSLENLNNLRSERFVSYIVDNVNIKLFDKSNRLLYSVLKHPGKMNIRLLRLAFSIYYRQKI